MTDKHVLRIKKIYFLEVKMFTIQIFNEKVEKRMRDP